MVAKSYEDGVETLLYEPISYVQYRPNVNPDSPRHFQTKRRRNVAGGTAGTPSSTLKQRPKSMILFRGGYSSSKKDSSSKSIFKRANTVNEQALKRTNSNDSIFDSSGKSRGGVKPITSRSKVQEIRKDGGNKNKKSDEKVVLSRSKSDAGYNNPPPIEITAETTPSSLQKANVERREYDADDLLKSRLLLSNYNYLYRGNSHSNDSLKTNSDISLSSSRNSSGFYEYSSAENEYETFSSDNSSINTDDILFQTEAEATAVISPPPPVIMRNHGNTQNNDKDKNAEGVFYSKSLKKNRRPLSITSSKTNSVRNSVDFSDDTKSVGSSLSPTSLIEYDVFNPNVHRGSVGCTSTHSAPSPMRTNKSTTKKKKKDREARPKSVIDIQTAPTTPSTPAISEKKEKRTYGRRVRIESVL